MPGISVIVPAYNEEKGIAPVLGDIASAGRSFENFEIIVVDDGSTDRTGEIAESCGVQVVKHAVNRGYGASLKSGIRAARYDTIVITDADGTYPSSAIHPLVEAMDRCDMAVGARIGSKVSIPLVRRPCKWILRILTQYVAGVRIPDFNSGLRAFSRDVFLQYQHLLPDKFSFTTTITVACLCDGLAVEFLPIDYLQRVGRSKMKARNFFNFIGLVLRLSILFRPLKVFMPVAAACSVTGLAKLGLDLAVAISESRNFLDSEIVSTTAVVLLLAGLQIALVGLLAEALASRSPAPPWKSRDDRLR